MYRDLTAWVSLNRERFGEMSFSYALTFLWVMTVVLIMNVTSFLGYVPDTMGVMWDSVVPLGDYHAFVPKLTAAAGFGTFLMVFLTTCVIAPLVEEMFRGALIQGFCMDSKTGEMKNPMIIGAMSFIFFGMLHGGYVNILIQGVLGLVLARLWFKVGGTPKSWGWRYLSMAAVHGAYNFCFVGIQLMVLRAVGA